MKTMSLILKSLTVTVIVCLLSFTANAGADPYCPPPTTHAPLDAKLIVLIAAAVGYVLFRAFFKRKRALAPGN